MTYIYVIRRLKANVRSSILWAVVQRSMMVRYWRCRTRHWSRLQGLVFHCLTLEGGTSVSSQNIGNKLPTTAGEHHRRAKVLGALWWKSEMLQVIDLIFYVKSLLSVRMIVPVYFLCHHLFFYASTHAIKSRGIHKGNRYW